MMLGRRSLKAKERGKTQSNFNEPPNLNQQFPTSEEEVIARSRDILKEMEYRSVRGAKMCYEHSADFDKKHLYLTRWVTFACACLSLPITNILIDSVAKGIGNGWSMCYTILVWLAITILTNLKFAPQYILPLYLEKQLKYNEAGAGWQELELNIRSYRATQIRDKIVLEELGNKLEKFAESRRKICEIALPSEEMHEKCEKDGFAEKIRRTKRKLTKHANIYFQTDQGDENT